LALQGDEGSMSDVGVAQVLLPPSAPPSSPPSSPPSFPVPPWRDGRLYFRCLFSLLLYPTPLSPSYMHNPAPLIRLLTVLPPAFPPSLPSFLPPSLSYLLLPPA
jgi:hypothetical protein